MNKACPICGERGGFHRDAPQAFATNGGINYYQGHYEARAHIPIDHIKEKGWLKETLTGK